MTTLGQASNRLTGAARIAAMNKICAERAEGWSEEHCARAGGIAGRTLRDWLAADPDFATAWRDANVARGDWVEDKLREGAAAGRDVPAIVLAKMTGRFIERQAPLQVQVSLYQVFQSILAPAPESVPAIIEHQGAPHLEQGERAEPQLESAPAQLQDGTSQPPVSQPKGRPSAKPASRRRPERTPLPR